jgi:bifunctional DNA-binding transcriptional regulator/antitoxin component of YhaV-PrlF toxin-antitoxin module|tara:strand:- start:3829 stop:4008 length:180 start_codon:yes stop_codon:yes gene_type:complete
MSYFIEVEELENGDLYVQIPEEVIETLGWEPETLLSWDIKGDGIIIQRLNGEGGFEPLE